MTDQVTEPDFDSGFNAAYHDKYDTQTSIVSDLVGGAHAAVIDFGASVWNSIPGTENVNTADLIARSSDNALRVYEEHPDAVEAASFIGGLFVPSGIALKGMTLARAGVKGANWFSAAGRAADLAKVETMFAEGAAATTEYRAAKTALYAKGLANQVLDTAAMEFAILGTMSAHPLLEDYMKDPIKNFAISVGSGGVIGGAVGHIVDRFVVGRLEGAIAEKVRGEVTSKLTSPYQAAQLADQVQIHQANIDTLEALINTQKQVTAKNSTNDLLLQVAEKELLTIRAQQNTAFESMLAPGLKSIVSKDQSMKDALLQTITSKGFQGVDSVSLLEQKLDAEANVFKMPVSVLSDTLNFTKKVGQSGKDEFVEVAYSPEFGKFYSVDQAKHYARARDLGKSAEQLAKDIPSHLIPNSSIAEESFTASAAKIDAAYIGALYKVDKMSVNEVKSIVLSTDDLPMRNAILARVQKETSAGSEAFKDFQWTITNNKPNYQAIEQAVYKQAGIGADHNKKLNDIIGGDKIHFFDMLASDSSVPAHAKDLLDGWRGGISSSVRELREGADTFFRGGYGGHTVNTDKVRAIYNSDESIALRAKFAKEADAEGNVYLYRGMKTGKSVGHSPVESYSTSLEKAKEFGTPKLYKVHVDDILGAILDPGKSGLQQNEILVGAPARQSVASLPIGTSAEIKGFASKATQGVEKYDAMALSEQLLKQKESTISSLLEQGIPFETIAIRTNTPIDTIAKFATHPEGTSLVEVGIPNEYRDASAISQYLNPSQRTLKLGSSTDKELFSKLRAGLDNKTMADMTNEIQSAILAGSSSNIARNIGEYFFDSEHAAVFGLLRAKVSAFVNENAGNRFLQSTDFYSRNMGEAGMIASTIGKAMQDKTNKAITSILEPINNAMMPLLKNPVALVEYNTAINVNASIKGWRKFDEATGQFFQKAMKISAETGEEIATLEPVKFRGAEFKAVTPEVKSLMMQHEEAGRELYALKNTINKMLGKADMSDIGLWIPAFNPKGKFISYVHNLIDDTTRLLWGNSAEELASAEKAFVATIPADRLGKEINIVTKGDQRAYNILNGRLDPLTMEIANIEMQHTGASTGGIIKANADLLGEIAGGYEHYIGSHTRRIAELSMHDTMDALTRMSQYNQRFFEAQTLGPVAKLTQTPKDAANVIKNTLLGNSNLNEYESWRQANQTFETGLNLVTDKVQQIWKEAVSPFIPKGIFSRGKEIDHSNLAKMDYETLSRKMEEVGAVNPWKEFDNEAAKLFGLAKITDHKDISKRVVYAGNALAATMALRVGELAQPLVNAMSLPILTSLAISNKMPETFLGIQKGTAKVGGVQIMYEGARAMHDPAFDALRTKWKDLGYFDPFVSEANKTLKLSRSFDAGAITKIEAALDSNIVKILSKPADFSESLVRMQTMHTGAVLAKRLYPELNDTGVTIFARDFMDKAVGNYHAAQRPVFFQGTMGVALGLFQTYMLTLGQAVYRHLEMKNYKAIGKAALAQSSIFGVGSMPGFHPISEAIGEHFSDHNIDLQTGTYRALGDKGADFLLYGMPSNIGPAFYSRGEIQPRIPNVIGGGVGNIVSVNMAMQMADMLGHIKDSIQAERPDVGRSLGEAISMQSMSRPLARGSELLTGYSVTRKGNTIAVPEDVWTPIGVMSRILSTRPTEETKIREAIHLNTFYGAADHKAREELTSRLKTSIRNGTLDDDMVAKFSEEYMRKGGTSTGWRSAYNTALAQTEVSGKQNLANKLRPDNPINFMIDNLD